VIRGLVFHKMSGSGNDFVILDGRYTLEPVWTGERIRWLCDRREGVGADGMVLLTPEAPGRVRMDFWNCDGSRADMCGNAALCSTRLAAFLELAPSTGMRLVTRAGTFLTRCRPGAGEAAELNLPDFDLPTPPAGLLKGAGESQPVLATVGVPHLVMEVADLERPDLMERGRELRSHAALGRAGANVNFVAQMPGPTGSEWRIRTYERGVEGETLACGTGAVAAAVALVQGGRATMPVTLTTRSTRSLSIRATLSGSRAVDVWLCGEGRLVFRGVL
jgi:diaminopimelate epimerase